MWLYDMSCYKCYMTISAATTTTTSRPSPPWLITSQPSVWSTAKLPSLRPVHKVAGSGGSAGGNSEVTSVPSAVQTEAATWSSTSPPLVVKPIPILPANTDTELLEEGEEIEVTYPPVETTTLPPSTTLAQWKTTRRTTGK